MPVTYKKIASVTLTSSQASIDFQNIPATYDDIIIKTSLRQTDGNPNAFPFITFNGTSSTNHSSRWILGTGSGSPSSGSASVIFWATSKLADTASTFGNHEIYIPNYTSSTNKSLSIDSVYENNGTDARQFLIAGLWSTTSVINRIVIQSGDNTASAGYNFVANSTAVLYGVKRS